MLGACTSDPVDVENAGTLTEAEQTIPTPDSNQAAILADGRITFTEYAGALNAAFACARAKGVRIIEPGLDRDGVTLSYSIAEDERGAATIDIFDVCYESLAMQIDSEFQTSPEVDAARRQYADQIVLCVFGDEAADWDSATRQQSARLDAPDEPGFEACRNKAADPRSIVASVSDS